MHSSRDMRIFRALGVESEVELALAALHELCVPLHRLESLPGPQRAAAAADALERLSEMTRASGSDWALGRTSGLTEA